MLFFALLTALGVLILGLTVRIYNRLVRLRNRYRNAFAQIDVQLKRRHDLIPNLVETVKGYMRHERETLEAVIRARNAAEAAREQAARTRSPEAMEGLQQTEGALGGVLDRLFALSEAYPALTADRSAAQLMEELRSTENRIAFARQAYNDAVMSYNDERESFHGALFAGAFNFRPARLFEITKAADREPVAVQF
ncbi:MAG: LemA family protein [Rhodothermales bacterium]|nr:LemA family protein [Rhodothermales bacterium]